ncbi:helix-turn-helix transcriptional regulator [Micromonospora sp. NPDC051006]|uniref:helix-turn-helix transcriptional regulator n=1 Tax=Micromonospora sp. NPDC051006 TaxID=3364283 RepID=UPI0037A0C16B
MRSTLPARPGRRERPAEAGTGGTTRRDAGWGKLERMTSTGLRREELAAFLRSRRARLRPAEVGLPDGVRRRTPGLRRQEVAQLAGMSIDYYIRLEQGRGPHPSRQVLAALARALLLSRDEREYLFRVAGETPPPTAGPSREVPPGLRHLIDAMTETPAYLVDASYEVLAWNRLASYFVGDLSAVHESDRNMIRWTFRRSADDGHWDDPETMRFVRTSVADLRAAYGRYPGDRTIQQLVTELLGTSPRFAQLWAEHDVQERRPVVKRVPHPDLGPLEFECRVLHVPETDQRLIVYVPEPGSPTQAAFRRLAERVGS